MTAITSTPPALRWVATFLAACAVLGLFLGFRDQIRKNPPGWYTGAEQIAVPLVSGSDGSREAVPFDPNAPKAPLARTPAPVSKAPEAKPETPADPAASDGAVDAATNAPKTVAPPVLTPLPAAKLKPTPPATRPAPSGDPVGDILEGQKQSETPAAVPY